MNIILSHHSALSFWCYVSNPENDLRELIARLGGVSGSHNRRAACQKQSVPLKTLLKKERICIPGDFSLSITKAQREAISAVIGACPPLHTLGNRNSKRDQLLKTTVHAWSGASSSKSLIEIIPGLWVCCPELSFIQLSSFLTVEELIYIGFEMCGTYCVSAPCGQEQNGVLLNRPALCTRKSIADALMTTPFAGNSKKAKTALAYILDGAASPPEAQLATLLTMPTRRGGGGFKAPQPNGVVLESPKDRVVSGKLWRACDLYWSEEKLTVEYDSEAFHSTREQRHNDAVRRNALVSAGIKVLSVTPDQLQNFNEFVRLEHALSKALSIEHRIRTKDYRRKHYWLHKEMTQRIPRWRRELGSAVEKPEPEHREAHCDDFSEHVFGRVGANY